MHDDLKGGTAVITGAGRRAGIGFAIAEKLASCGANVVMADLGGARMEDLQSLAACLHFSIHVRSELSFFFGKLILVLFRIVLVFQNDFYPFCFSRLNVLRCLGLGWERWCGSRRRSHFPVRPTGPDHP